MHISPEMLRKHDFALVTYEAALDPDLTTLVTEAGLPADSNSLLDSPACAQAGLRWHEGMDGVHLIVPSICLPVAVYNPDPVTDMRHGNVLINTAHAAAGLVRKVSVTSFRYDRASRPEGPARVLGSGGGRRSW